MDLFFDRYCRHLAARDRRLAWNMVYGILRQRQYLDEIIGSVSSRPLQKLHADVLMALRLGVYQLCFLGRIPASAAVNETVQAFRNLGRPRWLVNFVNGVLRAAARSPRGRPAGTGEGKSDEMLNHPGWLLKRWQKRWGTAVAREICLANNQPPVLTIRVNTGRITPVALQQRMEQAGYRADPGIYVDTALRLPQPHLHVPDLPGYHAGLFHVQDEAAQLATMLLALFAPAHHYLDGCGGVGGKSCQLAGLLAHGGRLTVLEPDRRRYGLLQANLGRLGLLSATRCLRCSLQEFATSSSCSFDGVLVDAPCSGTGVIRKHPDIRWNRHPKDLLVRQRYQLDLLAAAAPLVRYGGILVYATCSLEEEENDQVISRFLAAHPEFHQTSCAPWLPAPARSLVDASGFFRPLPQQQISGFFACRMVRSRVDDAKKPSCLQILVG